jgi:hypothetical protein
MRHFLFALLISLSVPAIALSPDDARSVVFGDGAAQVALPIEMKLISSERELKAQFGAAGDHLLQLSFNPSPPGAKVDGRDFVKAQAAAKDAELKSGSERVLFMDPGGDIERAGKTFRVVHWQIGVREGVFVLTVTAPVPMSAELDDFLGEGLTLVLNSVVAVGPN